MNPSFISFLLLAATSVDVASAFSPLTVQSRTRTPLPVPYYSSSASNANPPRTRLFSTTTTNDSTDDITAMRLSEIQKELKARNVSSKDCFDRESLTQRLIEARAGTAAVEDTATESTAQAETASTEATDTATSDSTANSDMDIKELKQEVAALSVKELRTELAASGKRWAGMLEKSDLVNAVVECRVASANFSASGKMQPGTVTDLTDAELQEELQSEKATPILLDVYATWCGPCQMMIPHLQETAQALGSRVRVGKLDSDKYQQAASQWNVQGLPTLLLLRGTKVIDRLEGMVTKDQLVPWVESRL